MSENPVLTLRDADARIRATQREISKLRSHALALVKQSRNPDRNAAQMLQRLDHMVALLEVPGLTRYRQATATPTPEPPGAPDDLRCKLCGEEKEPNDFFFDDGQGRYGYTGRCATCRSLPKRKRRAIADRRGLTGQSERNRAVGRTVGK